MAKSPQDRGKTRGLRVSDRSWNLWQSAAEALGLTLAEYMKITMDFASMRHLGMNTKIADELKVLSDEEHADGLQTD